jgi:glutamate racemase
LGTVATIASGAYSRALERMRPDVRVWSRACPLFVPLAEEGWVEGEVPERVAQRYLYGWREAGVDTLVLGCTHYPLLAGVVSQVVGAQVTLVDSARATAAEVRDLLDHRGLRSTQATPRHAFFVTDVPDRFVEVVRHSPRGAWRFRLRRTTT